MTASVKIMSYQYYIETVNDFVSLLDTIDQYVAAVHNNRPRPTCI